MKQDITAIDAHKNNTVASLPIEVIGLIFNFVDFDKSVKILYHLLALFPSNPAKEYLNLVSGITHHLISQRFYNSDHFEQKKFISISLAQGYIVTPELVYDAFRNHTLSFDSKLAVCQMQLQYPQCIDSEDSTNSNSKAVRLTLAIRNKFCKTTSWSLQNELLLTMNALIPTFPMNDLEYILSSFSERLTEDSKAFQNFHLLQEFHQKICESIRCFISNEEPSVMPVAGTSLTTTLPSGYILSEPLPTLSFKEILNIFETSKKISHICDVFRQFELRRGDVGKFTDKEIRVIFQAILHRNFKKLGSDRPDDPHNIMQKQMVYFNWQLFDSLLKNKNIFTKSLALNTLGYLLKHFTQDLVQDYPEVANQAIKLILHILPLTVKYEQTVHCFNLLLRGLNWSDCNHVFDKAKVLQCLELCIATDKERPVSKETQCIKNLFHTLHFRPPINNQQYMQQKLQANAYEFMTYLYIENRHNESGINCGDQLLDIAFKAIMYCGSNPKGDVRLKPAARLLLTITMNCVEEEVLFNKYSLKYQQALLLLLSNDHSVMEGLELYVTLNIKCRGKFQAHSITESTALCQILNERRRDKFLLLRDTLFGTPLQNDLSSFDPFIAEFIDHIDNILEVSQIATQYEETILLTRSKSVAEQTSDVRQEAVEAQQSYISETENQESFSCSRLMTW